MSGRASRVILVIILAFVMLALVATSIIPPA